MEKETRVLGSSPLVVLLIFFKLKTKEIVLICVVTFLVKLRNKYFNQKSVDIPERYLFYCLFVYSPL